MRAAELDTLQVGDEVFVRATIVRDYGDELMVRLASAWCETTVSIRASDVVNFAPLTLKRSGQQCAITLADVIVG